jgi:hypothetical protein
VCSCCADQRVTAWSAEHTHQGNVILSACVPDTHRMHIRKFVWVWHHVSPSTLLHGFRQDFILEVHTKCYSNLCYSQSNERRSIWAALYLCYSYMPSWRRQVKHMPKDYAVTDIQTAQRTNICTPNQDFILRAFNLLMAKGHTRYCGLVRGPHVEK